MRSWTRKHRLAAAIAFVLAIGVALAAAPVQSVSNGIDITTATSQGVRGCYCHSTGGASTDPNGNADISFEILGLDDGYYLPQKTYTIELAFDDPDVPMNTTPGTNKGGFNLWASGGTFKANGSSFVQVHSDGSISHSLAGDKDANRSFRFDWESPSSNASDLTFVILVNAVNGDGTNSFGLDHWSRKTVSIPGQPGAGGTLEISDLGVPLRAYWLGVIGILSTMFLLLLSFYVIRSGSKFYEFGLPRGQVKAVKIRTIPPPKNKGAYAVMTGLIVILIVIVISFMSIRDEQLDALQASGFLLAFFIVLVLAAVYYIRAFLPIVDVLEEETIEPLR